MVVVFAGFAEILEARMIFDLLDGHRAHLFGHQAGQAFVHRHAKRANALRAKPDGRGQHQVGAIRLQQIRRTDVGLKAPGDQGDHVHQGLGRLAAFRREVCRSPPGSRRNFYSRGGGVGLVFKFSWSGFFLWGGGALSGGHL